MWISKSIPHRSQRGHRLCGNSAVHHSPSTRRIHT